MSSTPQPLPARGSFVPRFILPNELRMYDLPDANRQPAILTLIDAASVLIDVHCGRVDGTGQGSLVYSTYFERLLMQAVSRNIVRLTFKPLVAIPVSVQQQLMASANYIPPTPKGFPAEGKDLLFTNYFYTGFTPNTTPISGVPGSTISPIIGLSGRYSYGRRDNAGIYPDLNYGANILQVAAFFGGPPNWTNIDITQSDFDVQTGEIWIPAGLYLAQYKEIVANYSSGFHPLFMPAPIKRACAGLVKNYLARGGGVTALRSISLGGTANVSFTPDLIDTYIERLCDPFKTVMCY
jgi:hypothetical protein